MELKEKVESLLVAMIAEATKIKSLKPQLSYIDDNGKEVILNQPRYGLATRQAILVDAISMLTDSLSGTNIYITAGDYQVIKAVNNSAKFNEDGSEMKSFINLIKISERVNADSVVSDTDLDELAKLMQ